MNSDVRKYLAEIGRKGGRKSRRALTSEQARNMVRIREARRAYRTFHTQCFWSCAPDHRVLASDVTWVGEQLMKHGGREAWLIGAKLCR